MGEGVYLFVMDTATDRFEISEYLPLSKADWIKEDVVWKDNAPIAFLQQDSPKSNSMMGSVGAHWTSYPSPFDDRCIEATIEVDAVLTLRLWATVDSAIYKQVSKPTEIRYTHCCHQCSTLIAPQCHNRA